MTRAYTKRTTSGTRLTRDEYDKIKMLTTLIKSNVQIKSLVNRSTATISVIKKSTDFDDYTRIYREYAERAPSKIAARAKAANDTVIQQPELDLKEQEKKTEIKQETFFYTPTEQTAIELTRIANALERLADAWEASPSKKGLFR